MIGEIKDIVNKAQRSLKVAQRLYKDGEYDFAVSRAYYSMFYMATALLLTKELSFSKHSGVISAFGQYFIKPGIFDKKYQKMFTEAFKARNIGDYDFSEEISEYEVKNVLETAKIFLGETEKYLKKMDLL